MPPRFVLVLLLVLGLPPSPLLSAAPDALAQAAALYDAKRVPEAREQLAALVDREPKNVRALHLLGLCELKMQRYDDSAATFARAVKLAPDDHALLADYGSACLLRADQLGTSFRAIGFARRGRAALEEAVAISPDTVAYREGLIQFYTRAPIFAGGSFSRAYAHIDEIAKRDPIRGAVIRAHVLSADGRHAEALAACEAVLADHPDSYLALYTLGRIAADTGQNLDRGEAAFRRCLELTPRIEEPAHALVRQHLARLLEKSAEARK